MPLKVTQLEIPEILYIEQKIFRDDRGFFMERYQTREFQQLGLPINFLQDNHSYSVPRVLRGLHFQSNPAQGKLVSVVRGKIWDVAMDIRHQSKTFGKYVARELSGEAGNMLWIPGGFAHGFCVLGDEPADVVYKVTEYYDAKKEGGITALDRQLNIDWPVHDPILSERDRQLALFAMYQANPVF